MWYLRCDIVTNSLKWRQYSELCIHQSYLTSFLSTINFDNQKSKLEQGMQNLCLNCELGLVSVIFPVDRSFTNSEGGEGLRWWDLVLYTLYSRGALQVQSVELIGITGEPKMHHCIVKLYFVTRRKCWDWPMLISLHFGRLVRFETIQTDHNYMIDLLQLVSTRCL